MAPGGKPVTICNAHIIAARRHRVGEAASVDILKMWNGLFLMANRSSMVETFIVWTRKRCQRYCANATDKAALREKPKALAMIFDAVVIYDCGATLFGPSAGFPSMNLKRMRWASAIAIAEVHYQNGIIYFLIKYIPAA
jgi:hypothetical protein